MGGREGSLALFAASRLEPHPQAGEEWPWWHRSLRTHPNVQNRRGLRGGVLRLVYPPPPPLSQLLDQSSLTAPHLQGGPGSWWLWASLSGTLTPSQSDSEPQRLPAPQYYSSPLHPHFLGQPLTPGCCDSHPPGLPGNARRQPSGMWPGRKAREATFGFTWGRRPGWRHLPLWGPGEAGQHLAQKGCLRTQGGAG